MKNQQTQKSETSEEAKKGNGKKGLRISLGTCNCNRIYHHLVCDGAGIFTRFNPCRNSGTRRIAE